MFSLVKMIVILVKILIFNGFVLNVKKFSESEKFKKRNCEKIIYILINFFFCCSVICGLGGFYRVW